MRKWFIAAGLLTLTVAACGSQSASGPPKDSEAAASAALKSVGAGYKVFDIPSGSMENTLKVGDKVLVALSSTSIALDDLVVFNGAAAGNNWPNVRSDASQTEPDFLKRVVAVGGDTIECPSVSASDPNDCDGILLNGKPVDESAFTYGTDSSGVTAIKTGHPTHHFDKVVVPQGELFVLGDHRDDSNDSRFNGTIKVSSVIGKVQSIIWPLDRAGPVQ